MYRRKFAVKMRKTFAAHFVPLVGAACLLFALFAFAACGGEEGGGALSSSAESLSGGDGGAPSLFPFPPTEHDGEDSREESDSSGTAPSDGVCRVGDFSVTLPAGFECQPADGFALYASDGGSAAALTVESFNDLYAQGMDVGMSAGDYACEVAKKGGIRTVVHDEPYGARFEYVLEEKGAEYRYFTHIYKGKTAFYLFQLCCLEDEAGIYGDSFARIADSVVMKPSF